jgi:hypothetical protein
MPRYHYDVSINRQKRFIRWFKKILLLCAGVVTIILMIIIVDTIRQGRDDNTETGTPVITEFNPAIREFESAYFKFTTPSNWRRITDETTDKQYVFRSYRGDLVEQELKVYVNDPTADLLAVRVLPVRVDEKGHLIPGGVSEHCSKAAGTTKSSGPVNVTMEQVTFSCQTDGTNFLLVVGERGGGTSLKLKRPSGGEATYSFIYRSSSVPTNTTDLIDILNSFVTI